MGRLFELTVFAVFLWLALESWVARLTGRGSRRDPRRAGRGATPAPRSRPRPQATAPRSSGDLTLVRCAACGTHVPQSRTVAARGALYCSVRCAGAERGAEKDGAARGGERAG